MSTTTGPTLSIPRPDSVEWALPTRERRALVTFALLSLALVLAVGVLDVASGTELVLSPFYLFAVIFGTWRGGACLGFATAIASAFTGLMAEVLLSDPYLGFELSQTSPSILFWNAIARGLVLLAAVVAVSKLQVVLRDRDDVARELQRALGQIRTLESLLPVCAWCKRIRDESDADAWKSMERYIVEHTNTKFTHGMCPECCERVWKEEGL